MTSLDQEWDETRRGIEAGLPSAWLRPGKTRLYAAVKIGDWHAWVRS